MLPDLINNLREQQFQLRCEREMHLIQSANKNEYLKLINTQLENLRIEGRKIYLQ